MEVWLLLGIAAAGIAWLNQSNKSVSTVGWTGSAQNWMDWNSLTLTQQTAAAAQGLGPPGWIPPQPTPLPNPFTPPPDPGPPPAPPPALKGPGVYPAGTPGTFPFQLQVFNSDGNGQLSAQPGGSVREAGSLTLWYGPGTQVLFRATVDSSVWAIFTGFDHFEGPNGVQSRQNPIVFTINGPGFLRAVFAFLGRT